MATTLISNPIWGPQFFSMGLTMQSSEKKQTKLEKMPKNLILGPILAHLTRVWTVNFFFGNLVSLVTRYHGQLSSCAMSEKTNDPILRKLGEWWTEKRRRVIS